MSFINSVFVDAMVEDNNDDIKNQLDRIERKLNELEEKIATKNDWTFWLIWQYYRNEKYALYA